MDSSLILFCLMGGIVYADTDAVGQFMISQPLIACTVAGWLLGSTTIGFTVGVLLQLPYLVEIPIGGAKIPQGNLGAFVAAGLATMLTQLHPHKANLVLMSAILIGVFLSSQTIPLQDLLCKFNRMLLHRADRAAEHGNLGQLTVVNYVGVLAAYLFGGLLVAVFSLAGYYVCRFFLEALPANLESRMGLLKPVLLGAGFGAVLWHFLTRNTLKFTVVGTLVGVAISFLKLI